MQGMGLYIFGDNQPFFVDANRLLDAMAFELDTKIPNLRGNNPGEHRTDVDGICPHHLPSICLPTELTLPRTHSASQEVKLCANAAPAHEEALSLTC